jgi:hypothetical protein
MAHIDFTELAPRTPNAIEQAIELLDQLCNGDDDNVDALLEQGRMLIHQLRLLTGFTRVPEPETAYDEQLEAIFVNAAHLVAGHIQQAMTTGIPEVLHVFVIPASPLALTALREVLEEHGA